MGTQCHFTVHPPRGVGTLSDLSHSTGHKGRSLPKRAIRTRFPEVEVEDEDCWFPPGRQVAEPELISGLHTRCHTRASPRDTRDHRLLRHDKWQNCTASNECLTI